MRVVKVLTYLLLSISFLLLFWPNCLRRLMRSQNTSRKTTNLARKRNLKNCTLNPLTSANTTKEVLKTKETFSNLQTKKIENIISNKDKVKPKLHMIIKEPSRKQVIFPMSNDNKAKFITESNTYIVSINRAFKNIKLEVKADFVWAEQAEIIITTNKIAAQLDLQTIEQYVKSMNHIEADNVKIPCLPQFKSYLKIIDISYLLECYKTRKCGQTLVRYL